MVLLLGWRYLEEHRTVRYLDFPNGESAIFVEVEGLGERGVTTLNSYYRLHAYTYKLTSEAVVDVAADKHTHPFTLSSLTEVGNRHNNTIIPLSSAQVHTTLTYTPTQASYFSGDNKSKVTYRAVLDTVDLTVAHVAHKHSIHDTHSYRCGNGILTYLPLTWRGIEFLRERGLYVRSRTFGLPNEPEITLEDAGQEAGESTD